MSVISCCIVLATGLAVPEASEPDPTQTVIVVVGAAGEETFGEQFAVWSQRWKRVCELAKVKHIAVGEVRNTQKPDFETLHAALESEPKQWAEPLWIVLIGHGTFDGRKAKFNLQGPDLTAEQLAQWLKPFERTVVVINCASASSPFIHALAAKNRLVVTATKSGYQYNFARFGDYFSHAIGDLKSDLDKDGQVSLLEAYLFASSRVQEFYQQEARLATEHALLDDNGDGLGTPATWFRGIRVVKKPKGDAAVDGQRARQLHLLSSAGERTMTSDQRKKRDALELQLEKLREKKETLDVDDYYAQLLPAMLELAKLYDASDDQASDQD